MNDQHDIIKIIVLILIHLLSGATGIFPNFDAL